MKKKLYVIDGHALCYRAFFAFMQNPLTNSKGQNVSAIFGFFRMLLKLVAEQKPDYLAVAFDPVKKSFRFEKYAEYKANRQKMPDELRSQIEEIKRAVSSIGLPVMVMEGWEADDILGSVAKQFSSKECEVVLVTGDKDAYQLVGDNVSIYANKKGISEYEIYHHDEVVAKLGITPEQVIDYMALTGDTSDNVPGIKGVGEKTALKLITEYGSLDSIYSNAEKIKGKLGETVRASKDMAYLSQDLVTIRTDIDLGLSLNDLEFKGFDSENAAKIFISLEMKSIVNEFFKEQSASKEESEKSEINTAETVKHTYKVVSDIASLKSVITEASAADVVSVDTETTSVKPVDAELVGISISIKEGQGWYIPVVDQDSLFSGTGLPKSEVISVVKPMLENPSIKKVGQNIKYDMIIFRNEGVQLRGVDFDSMIASYIVDPTERKHNLDDMALYHLNYKTILYEELVGKGKNAVKLRDVDVARVAEYACEDSDIALKLCNILKKEIEHKKLSKLYYDIELPLVYVLASMEYAGVKIDRNYFASLAVEIDERLKKAEKEIHENAKEIFNINSTKELSRILFEKLALRTVKKTKTGFSTDISVLEELKGSHPIIDSLIEYRMLSKLKGTYVDALPELISPRTGRIHTSFNQTIVATGRLSSSDPNLQNIPIKDEFGGQIRRGFIAEDGFEILSADYSQIELRIAASISGDENMKRAFLDNIDIHSMTASSVFDTPIEKIEPWMRRQAKVINFATIYGVTAFGLSRQADISIKDAARFIKKYYETYPRFQEYIDRTVKFARENGYIETLLGRQRPVPDINSSAQFVREGAERIAINTPIQGSSADMIKVAMIGIHREIENRGLKSRMILQVHDELVFEVAEEEKLLMNELVREKMEKALVLDVPVVVEMGWGRSWGEAH